MKPETEAWLTIAHEDLQAAELLLRSNLFRMVCLHSQQAVEKTLKALLTECETEFRKTHNIVDLLSLLNTQGISMDVSHEEAGFLNAVSRSRYPAEAGLLPEGEPTEDDAAKALTLAQKVIPHGEQVLEKRGRRT